MRLYGPVPLETRYLSRSFHVSNLDQRFAQHRALGRSLVSLLAQAPQETKCHLLFEDLLGEEFRSRH